MGMLTFLLYLHYCFHKKHVVTLACHVCDLYPFDVALQDNGKIRGINNKRCEFPYMIFACFSYISISFSIFH